MNKKLHKIIRIVVKVKIIDKYNKNILFYFFGMIAKKKLCIQVYYL